MSETYGVGRLLRDGELYDKWNQFDYDLEFYKKWCTKSPGPVLELCAGTGRLTIPLKQSGIDITGLEISDSMIEAAINKAKQAGVKIDFIKGDIRDFSLPKKYSTVIIPFNSFQCIYSIEDIENVFRHIKTHLTPNGLLVFDIFNPSIHILVEKEHSFSEISKFTLNNGNDVIIKEKGDYDDSAQVNKLKLIYQVGDEEFTDKLDMRCFFPLEMDALVKYINFVVIHKFGNFDEVPFGRNSPKQIYVCKLKNQL